MGKLGKCPECPAGSRDVLLIGGKCYGHFNKVAGSSDREKKVDKKDKDKEVKATLSQWFKEQEKQIPLLCENCGKAIHIPAALPLRTAVCHIVPKRTIKSVQTHPNNRWFGCWQCHSDFDQHPAEKVAKMPVIKKCRERFITFEKLIPESEKRYIPDYLLSHDKQRKGG